MNSRPALAALVAICCTAWLAGCVVVDEKPKTGLTRVPPPSGVPVKPNQRPPERRDSSSARLPEGPVAKPASSAEVADARVVVGVRPIGRVPYDGLSLPLVSPDGRFIATQTGQAPPWEALLAEPGVGVTAATTLAAFAIVESPASASSPAHQLSTTLQVVGWRESPSAGLLLGRSADTRGFLVESPRAGSPEARWIGRVDWITGKLEWLVTGEGINTFATFGPSGELVYSRFDRERDAFDLVIRPRADDASGEIVCRGRDARESLVFPLCSLDRDHAYAIAVPRSAGESLSVVAIALPGSKRTPAEIVARRALGVEASLASAFQCVAPMQTPWTTVPPVDLQGSITSGIALVSARTRSVIWFDALRDISTLAINTASAVPMRTIERGNIERSGLLLATGKELVFQAISDAVSDSAVRWSRETSVLSGASIPRVIGSRREDVSQLCILFEPGKPGGQAQNGAWLTVWMLAPLPSTEP
jgi:hypothetical protein